MAPRLVQGLIKLAVAVAVAVPAGATAQSDMSAEELYTDYFGCWTCHGPRGGGGDGRPLRGTYLPLSLFMKELRQPAGEMPPFSDLLATDEELVAVYAWLEGADAVEQPMPLTTIISATPSPGTGGDQELTVTTRAVRGLDVGPAGDVRFRLRVTLMMRDNSLVADQVFEVQAAGAAEWAALATDRYGQLLLGPEAGTAVRDLTSGEGETFRLRLELAAGTYVVVLEAVSTDPDGAPILGVGSWVMTVES